MNATAEQRQRIIALALHSSKSQAEIAKDIGVSQPTVSRIIRRHHQTGSVEPQRKGRCGRKRKTTPRDDKKLLRKSLCNPRLTAIDLKREEQLPISARTVRRRLREGGRIAMKPVKKPMLTKAMIAKRLQWARDHRHYSVDDWKNVS